MVRRPRRVLYANVRYLAALLKRFRFTVVMAVLLFGVLPALRSTKARRSACCAEPA